MGELGIIVLAFNEIDSLQETIIGLQAQFPEIKPEIIISTSNFATQGCKEMAEKLATDWPNVTTYYQIQHYVAAAVLEAVEILDTKYVIYMSADGETPFEACKRLFDRINQSNADLVLSSRWIAGGSLIGYGVTKSIISKFAQVLCKVLFWSKLSEYTYGYRIYRREIFTHCNFYEHKHPFFLETLLVPLRLGYRIEEIPVKWVPRREASSVSDFRTLLTYFRPIIAVRFRPLGRFLK